MAFLLAATSAISTFALSLSKGRSFMVRQAHHERDAPLTVEVKRPWYRPQFAGMADSTTSTLTSSARLTTDLAEGFCI